MGAFCIKYTTLYYIHYFEKKYHLLGLFYIKYYSRYLTYEIYY
jgi:hypothetical protein